LKKWLKRGLLLGISVIAGIGVYDEYRGGYYSLPDLPNDAYAISFQNGFKAILYNVELEFDAHVPSQNFFRRLSIVDKNRRYLGIPWDVAPWFEDTWSHCKATGQEAQEFFESSMPQELKSKLAGTRFEAICLIEGDDTRVIRGAIYSVPA